MIVANSRKKCPVTYSEVPQFFSLVDYRNNYFTSDDPNKIMEFYNGFENRDQLIQWMNERPKGVANIHEVKGDKEIIVVIPTADFNGKYAKECRDNIFKGPHMVFVESGGKEDFYFNIAHNVNIGISKAIEYNPKWIVFSGDDTHIGDGIDVLRDQLAKLDERIVDSVFLKPQSDYYSVPMVISKITKVRNLVYFLLGKKWNKQRLFERKFHIKYAGIMKESLAHKYLYKDMFEFINFISFGIFSINAIQETISRDGFVFDETFINNSEDGDLSIRLALNSKENVFINFRIVPEKGGTLGWSVPRFYRDIAGAVYLSRKMEDYFEREYKNYKSMV